MQTYLVEKANISATIALSQINKCQLKWPTL